MSGKQFTDSFIKSLKSRDDRYEISEHGGLKIRVSKNGAKSWVYVFRQNGKLKRLTLGQYPHLSLADARVKATLARASKLQGEDPIAHAMSQKLEFREALTVNELSELYIEKHAKIHKKTWKEDQRILSKYVKNSIGNILARDVKRMHIRGILDNIAAKSPYSANRALEIIRKMYNWSIERDVVETNPCLNISRPKKEQQRDRVLIADEIKIIWNTLESTDIPDDTIWPGQAVRYALQLAFILAVRRSEIALAKVEEFDFDTCWWTIPAERSKNGLSHRVYLSGFAIEIIKNMISLNKGSDFLMLSSRHADMPIDPNALTRAVSRIRAHLDIPNWRLHDIRRTAASHMASHGVSRLVIKKILNHVESDITAVYDRHSYDNEKSKALELWSEILKRIVYSENIVALKKV